MEGNSSSERRKGLKNIKQCVKNISRSKQTLESHEDINFYCLNGPNWVPVGLPVSRGTSILETKVKALKEKRVAVNRQAEAASHERASPKKTKAWKGKALAEPTSHDAVVEPQAQIRTYLTDVLLDSTEYPQVKKEESQGRASYAKDFETLPGSQLEEGDPKSISWSSPEEYWKHSEIKLLDKKGYSGRMARRTSPNGLYGASSLKDLSCIQKTFEEANGEDDHVVQVGDFENHPFLHKNNSCKVVTTGRLWRTESWDSLGSGGSNASTVSLAEKVERNRSVLQEMLNTTQLHCHSSRERHTLHRHKKDAPVLGNVGPSNDTLANDIDWDSGVSLQDSEGYRAFVSNPAELKLSPRHEQAKQLLQRARMKARTNPLRASHHILPAASQERRDISGISVVDGKRFAVKDGDPHASGNLSDSSSGESSCGQQRKRGPSPSRVRFEDESARDAEVRYLERSQHRQKRVLDSVLLSLGRGPLVSKPDLSAYINGDLHRNENGFGKISWEHQDSGHTLGVLGHQSSRGRSEKGKPLVINEEGKCTACGSYVSNLATSGRPDIVVNQNRKDTHQTISVSQESKDRDPNKELTASQQDLGTRTLGPKGTPVWILPSRQRIYTEHIKETYIGEVTCIDDVDSALESTTDTSDSYRTDSEETGTGNRQSLVKSHWQNEPGPVSKACYPSGKITRDGKKKTEGERPWGKACCGVTGEEAPDNRLRISREEIGPNVDEGNNCNLKRTCEVIGPATKMSSIEVESFAKGNQPTDPYELVKKCKAEEHTRGPKALFREPTTTSSPQQMPVHPVSDGVTDSMNKKPVESTNHTFQPSNNLRETRQIMGPSLQLTKQVAASCQLVNQVPAPPATGRAHSSPMPYRRAALKGSYKWNSHEPGLVDQASVYPATPDNLQRVCVSQLEEQSGLQNPKMLSKHQLLALSTNNCNNTHAKHKPKTSMTVAVRNREEKPQDSRMVEVNQGPSSSACDDPTVPYNAISSTAISLLLTTGETDATAVSTGAPMTEAQKAKQGQTVAGQCKPLEIYPETKKKPFAKKGGAPSSSASGLKKFFTTLSQSTKQKLGRFRCYSMEQICAPESQGVVPVEEPGPDTTSSPKMKKAPSLQSLRLVSPFRQPRKASSVQNLQSLLGKSDRSSFYLPGEQKDSETVPNRKPGAQQQRSLSVEDIGSPNLVRTVGRVVEVFPDGTSQLELQRTSQGNFGFRVSSGNGRPDRGIYVQEMADASTAKLYAGLLGVGDEILEVNGAKVAGLGLAQINELLLWADTLSVRVLRQRPAR
ncbi:hypothetical protein JRQ81_014328 [Phrynocephalus forsythii]|uniref:PDZ domain-containing protein n=1 Tax=Phrynocephalus forsythii TaxID=171643 RepID=A0A9Q0XWH7_9SAUR|nr:hypothetical protein JRQ81_014328 [Phrynocephalus forsythii]